MITGCPIVNLITFTVGKLQKILNDKIFKNKKAYVYTLNKKSELDMRIDRIIGLEEDGKRKKPVVKI